MSDEHHSIYAEFCGPRLGRIESSVNEGRSEREQLKAGMASLSAKIENGLSSRVRQIERMQWWQIGILVSLVTVMIGGLWVLYRASSDERTDLRKMILENRVRIEMENK